MKKHLLIYILLPFISLSLASCGGGKKKSRLGFTGRENAEQAFAKCVQLSTKKKFQESIDCLEIFKTRFPNSDYALQAELKVGDAYFLKKEYLLAAETYQFFTKLHPDSDKLDYAFFKMGMAYLKATPKKIDRDQEHLPQAISSFSLVVSQFPSSTYYRQAKFYYDQARRMVAKRVFYIGNFYYKWGEFRAAGPRFEEVFEKYPGLGLDQKALYYAAKSYQKLGKNEVAQQYAEILKSKYPKSKYSKKAVKEILKEKAAKQAPESQSA